jgi:hypothetical protein
MEEPGLDRANRDLIVGSAPLSASSRSVSELVRHLARIAAERDDARRAAERSSGTNQTEETNGN